MVVVYKVDIYSSGRLAEWLSKLLSSGCCLQGSYKFLRMVCLINFCPLVVVHKAAT
jgi:hypothetical protein